MLYIILTRVVFICLFQAHVELLDVNDTPPRFSQNYYTVDVDENVQPDFVVTRVAVYDDDSLGGLQLTLNVGSDVNLKINQDGKKLSPVNVNIVQAKVYGIQCLIILI